MSTPLRRSKPNWLSKQSEHDPNLSPSYRRSVRYFRKLYQAWPEWCAEHNDFKEIYTEAKQRRKDGEDVQVDHIVPICSDIVSGLHVPWNLAIIHRKENMKKSNHTWPDMPYEQLMLI